MFDQHRPTTNLVVNFDRLNVFPFLDGLGEIHHAQWNFYFADLKKEMLKSNFVVDYFLEMQHDCRT